jgi:type VI secretion system protein ImpA
MKPRAALEAVTMSSKSVLKLVRTRTIMSIVDVDVLLEDLEEAAPCGPNLEYDPAFMELEQSALGKPEVQYGDTIVPAVPPEWKQVKKQALDLFARTRDLRVAMPLVRALLALHAMPGFADGVRLLERLVEERWDSVHPELDPDDDNDPLLRINSLAQLTDPATILRDLRETAFVMLPGLGALTLRVLEQANGEAPVPDGQTALTPDSIEAALADVSEEAMQAATAAVNGSLNSVTNLEAALVRHVGSAQALTLGPLTRQLRRMADLLASRAGAAQDVPADASSDADGEQQGGGTAAPRAAAITGDVASRADVIRMIDKILAYYQRYEPSSPVPMLLERAKRLAPMSFMEVMENLAPDSMQQLNVIRGPQPGESNGSDDY